jgi:hypothetical protein
MTSQQVYIDHLLLQFNQEQFENLPSWISDNFTVINGGVHTGKTIYSIHGLLQLTHLLTRWPEPK